jgi:endonuclease/exonuclease/phosphatase family metal-dependent hydrolase
MSCFVMLKQKEMKNKLLKIILFALTLPVLAFAILLTYSTVTDYKPAPGSIEILPIEGDGKISFTPDTFKVMIWNIGYGGLGAEMDFFHDGGNMVRPEQEKSAAYLKAISLFISEMRDSIDFILLQEVDRNSKRSYYRDQMVQLREGLPGYFAAFALNYHVRFVPVPFRIPYTPYGSTYGGLVTYSKYRPLAAHRLQYPGGFSWPTNLFMLDRCALEQRFRLKSGRELVLINTHNTAYDETGDIKKEEMKLIRERYGREASSGKLVILGGDWNQLPPGYPEKKQAETPEGYTANSLDQEALPTGFKAIFDTIHTNRALTDPYIPGKTFTTLIDYFIVSPGLNVLNVQTIDMQFRWSDHQPVILTVTIR